jgi:hypothetical protein
MARRSPKVEVEITEGAIRVTCAGRRLTLLNEAPPPDVEEADFFIRLDDIEHWDAPHQDEAIEIDELQKILETIEARVEAIGLCVVFE